MRSIKEINEDLFDEKICDAQSNKNNHYQTYGSHEQRTIISKTSQSASDQRRAVPITPFCRGSLTLEAALVLPFLISAILLLTGLMTVMGTYGRLNSMLCQTARQMGAYSRSHDGVSLALAYQIFHTDMALSGVDTEDILGGQAGVVLSLEEAQEDWFTLKAVYTIRLPGFMLPSGWMVLKDQISFRAFTGLDESSFSASGESGGGGTVYIAATGKVYHTNENCTYLDLSIRGVNPATIGAARNVSGHKYYPCESCGSHAHSGVVYITSYGEAWHTDQNCSGLKRTVGVMTEEEAKASGMHECYRCQGSHE